jgi:O-antigen/teichoic acid export membrane protein
MSADTSNLTRKTSFIMFYNIFGALLGYVTLFFVLRVAGTTAWGILGAATGTVGLLTLVADFGLSNAHVKKIAEGENLDEKISAYIILKIAYATIFVALAFLSVFVVTDIFGFHFESEFLKQAVIITIFYYFLLYIGGIFKTTLRAHMKTTQAIIPDFLRVVVQDASLIAFTMWWLYSKSAPLEFVGVLYTYGYLISVFVQLLALMYLSRKYIVYRTPSISVVKEYVLFALPLGLFGAVGIIQGYTDRAMLQFFWNYKEVGAYFSIQRIMVAITTFGMAVNFVLYPAQSHHFSQGNMDKFREITLGAERYSSLIILPLVAFGIALAPEILNLWNRTLTGYALVLQILLIYAYLYVINTPYGSQLVSAGKPKENLKAGIVQASMNVILNGVLIPSSILGITLFGLKSVGAAIATLSSFSFGLIMIRYKVYRHLGAAINWRIMKHVLSATVSATVIYLINTELHHFIRFYEVGIAFVIFAGMYAGILFAMREISIDELRAIIFKFVRF